MFYLFVAFHLLSILAFSQKIENNDLKKINSILIDDL